MTPRERLRQQVDGWTGLIVEVMRADLRTVLDALDARDSLLREAISVDKRQQAKIRDRIIEAAHECYNRTVIEISRVRALAVVGPSRDFDASLSRCAQATKSVYANDPTADPGGRRRRMFDDLADAACRDYDKATNTSIQRYNRAVADAQQTRDRAIADAYRDYYRAIGPEEGA